LKEIYAEADETELMKMAVKNAGRIKVERDEIDENDWVQIQVAIEEALHNILTFRKEGFH
jgi:anti-sigma regulatory factor (Ser/Thr protein kinase)